MNFDAVQKSLRQFAGINLDKNRRIPSNWVIVKEEMVIRSKLLEEVANRILDRFFLELKMIKSATVSVAKLNPPIGGNVQEVVIILTKER